MRQGSSVKNANGPPRVQSFQRGREFVYKMLGGHRGEWHDWSRPCTDTFPNKLFHQVTKKISLRRPTVIQYDDGSRFIHDPDFFTDRDFRAVELATVAARLLGRKDKDYANAAHRALRLMDCCSNVLRANERRRDADNAKTAQLKAIGVTGIA